VSGAPKAPRLTVTSASGEALPRVRVSARVEEDAKPDFERPDIVAVGDTDEMGVVTLAGLDDGRAYTLVATAPDDRWKEFADLCVLRWRPADATLTLPAANALKGVVRDPKRKPVPFARVNAAVGPWVRSAIADKDGAFEFLNAPPGEAVVYADLTQKDGEPLVSPSLGVPSNTTTLALTLPAVPRKPQLYLTVRVYTPGGRPVVRADGSFGGTQTTIGPTSRQTSSFSSGTWITAGAARTSEFSVPTWLEVVGARTAYGERLPCGPARGGPYGPGPREGELRLPPEMEIEGHVYGPGDSPLPGIRVQALPEGDAPGDAVAASLSTEAPHGEGVSGVDGSFRIGGLEKRKYELRPRSTNLYVGGGGGIVEAGTKDAEIHMRLAVRPFVTLRDEAGKPISNAVVRVKPPGSLSFFGTPEIVEEKQTNADGRTRIEGLDPKARYTLTVYPPTERSDLLSYELAGWLPENTDLTLERARRIAGVVHDQDGEPVPGARLSWSHVAEGMDQRGKTLSSTAAADGTFALENLRSGKYRIWVRAPKGVKVSDPLTPAERADPEKRQGDERRKPRFVPSGAEGVILKLAMPSTLELRLRAWTKKLGKPDILLVASGKEGIGPASISKRLDKEGRVTFTGLRWNVKYSVWMGDLKDGKYVLDEDLRPQERKLELRLMSGKTIEGRVDAPKGTTGRKVYAVFPGFEVKGKMKSAGRFEIEGVPPGPWTLRATGKLSGDVLTTEVQAKPDEEIVIELKEPPPPKAAPEPEPDK
jgi:hypothetical protein